MKSITGREVGRLERVIQNTGSRPRKLLPFGEKAHHFAFRHPARDRRITILEGAVRSSKTWATLIKTVALCQYRVTGQRLITGASRATIKANFLNDLFEIVGDSNYDYNHQSGELRLFDTRWRVIGAKDEGSEKFLRGATVGLAVSDELTLAPKSFAMMLLSRLSPEGARWYATTNPDSPYHYVKADLIDNPALAEYLEVVHLGLDDNPNLTEDYKQFIQRSYTGVWFQRFVLGLWVLAEGAIYRDCLTEENYYDDSTRPVGLHSRGGHVERWICVDAGTANAQVYGDFYDDGTILWLDNEYYWDSRKEGRQKTNGEYADDLLAFIGAKDPREWPGIITDPSAASFQAELRSRGMYVLDADNEVLDGIRRVSAMLGRKRLRIHRRCVNVIREMQTYSWDERKTDKGTDQPLKKHDHGPDMIRYQVNTRISDWRLAA